MNTYFFHHCYHHHFFSTVCLFNVCYYGSSLSFDSFNSFIYLWFNSFISLSFSVTVLGTFIRNTHWKTMQKKNDVYSLYKHCCCHIIYLKMLMMMMMIWGTGWESCIQSNKNFMMMNLNWYRYREWNSIESNGKIECTEYFFFNFHQSINWWYDFFFVRSLHWFWKHIPLFFHWKKTFDSQSFFSGESSFFSKFSLQFKYIYINLIGGVWVSV